MSDQSAASGVSCDAVRVALSARLDGERAALDDSLLDAHVAGCEECQRWYSTVTALGRNLTMGVAGEELSSATPKSGSVEAALQLVNSINATSTGRTAPLRRRRTPMIVARICLAVLAVVYILWAGLLLFGAHSDASIIVDASDPLFARYVLEAAVTRFALGVGLACVAWRPAAASGALPVYLAMWAFGAGIATRDIVMGLIDDSTVGAADPLWTLIVHFVAVIALIVVWAGRQHMVMPLQQSWRMLSARPMTASGADARRNSSFRPGD